jgi:hypothetical protein
MLSSPKMSFGETVDASEKVGEEPLAGERY